MLPGIILQIVGFFGIVIGIASIVAVGSEDDPKYKSGIMIFIIFGGKNQFYLFKMSVQLQINQTNTIFFSSYFQH